MPRLRQQLLARQPELLPSFAGYYIHLQYLSRRMRRNLRRQMGRPVRKPPIAVCPADFGSGRGDGARGRPMSFAGSAHLQRRLQRKWARSAAGVALLLALGEAPALAATINVRGGCSLVDAMTAANTNNAIGGCRAGSGADTIVLTAGGTHTLATANNPNYGPSGLPIVTSTLTIAGNGSTIARSTAAGTPEFRIFAVGAGGNLTLRQTTVSGGLLSGQGRGGGAYRREGALTLAGCTISGNSAYLGGGVATNLAAGTLTVTNSTISGNSADLGGGLFNGGSLIVANSTILGNTAQRNGGGMRNDGTATLINSIISSNTAGDDGGGVASLFESLTLINSTVSGNTSATSGGGISNYQGAIVLNGTLISGNTATRIGGGVANFAGPASFTNSTISGNTASYGGGAINNLAIMSLINSTVSGNTASGNGGGVFSGGASGNLRSDVVLFRTLVSGNTATSGAEVLQRSGGVITASNFNLFGHSGLTNAQAFFGFTPGGADITATSDGSVPTALASILTPAPGNNGGLTQTHALVLGSPALDAVITGCPPPSRDQRGVPRPQDGNNDTVARCDIGAFEQVPPGIVTCDGLPANKIGTPASETITGTPGADVVQGLGGNDVIQGLAGNDVICGGPGNDRVVGGPDADRLFGGAGVDRINGALGFDRCNGGPPATGDTAVNCEQLSNVP